MRSFSKEKFSHPGGRHRLEYLKLVWRQLQCGKTRLRRDIKAAGSVFAVPKSQGRQREVWDGSLVSRWAEKPPAPQYLANPSCFVDLLFPPSCEVLMSKRDVHTCFDVLRAPESVQPWFGRPPVTLHELSQVAGVSAHDLKHWVVDHEHAGVHDLMYPASTVWPMGFSWSSCIAQAATVACCMEAGVDKQSFMAMDLPPPVGKEACGVATDDTFFFHFDRQLGQRRLGMLDEVLEKRGMPKNEAKDVTLQASMTALGCILDSAKGTAEPAPKKLGTLFLAWIGLLDSGHASPVAFNKALGLHQWFCLLQRPQFSIFDGCYKFVRQTPEDRQFPLPAQVRAEIFVAMFLMPLLGADLQRKFLSRITACDAAPEFGFGVSYLDCPGSVAERVSLLAERRGDFVRFYPDADEPPAKERRGQPHDLPYSKRCFTTAISAKARFKAHSGALEAHALLLAIKWLLRSPAHYNSRPVILVDAKAVLGAATKGRTSAPGIRGVMRHVGALLLASNCLLKLVYVPTEYNPADAPSRGKRGKPIKRTMQKVKAAPRSAKNFSGSDRCSGRRGVFLV